MADDRDAPTTATASLSAVELADLVGDPVGRVHDLTTRGVLTPDQAGRYDPGDAHRIRVIDGFEAAGVPLEVLVRAQEAGLISVAYYDELHAPPGRPSTRTYKAFRASLGPRADRLPAMFRAFGIAEPDRTSHLSLEDEAVIADWASTLEMTGEPDLALRVLRQFGEGTRRASAAALEAYAEVIERMGPDFAGVPPREVYERVFQPWAKAARTLPALAGWLTRHHMSRAIDDYSIGATEQVLADSGYVPHRAASEPAVAFLDLTGFTRLTQVQGDVVAADVALRLADLAASVVSDRDGRVVKLLGDGVLMQFRGVVAAVEASLDLLDRLVGAGMPPGHVGVTSGPVVARDGDIYGRTVNLAARISDVTPSGELYVPASIGGALEPRYVIEAVGARSMPGVGSVELARVSRPHAV